MKTRFVGGPVVPGKTVVFDHVKGEIRQGTERWMPLSARHSRRKRIAWRTKNGRERVALWLAPWLRTWGQ